MVHGHQSRMDSPSKPLVTSTHLATNLRHSSPEMLVKPTVGGRLARTPRKLDLISMSTSPQMEWQLPSNWLLPSTGHSRSNVRLNTHWKTTCSVGRLTFSLTQQLI